MNSMDEMIAAAQAAAQQIERQMAEVQARLDTMEVEGQAGGGLVTIRASAKGRLIAVSIDDSLMAMADKAMLEDLVAAAFNDARARADQVAGAELTKAQAAMGLPPGLKLPGM